MQTNALKIFFILFIFGHCASAFAHKYFFGLTEMSVNPRTNNIEIIHQFTAHDLENVIAETRQEHFSPEHASYEDYIQHYFNQHFQLKFKQQAIPLTWIGLEIVNGQMFIYQEAVFQNNLAGLVVKNDLLVDTYYKQVNTVNYQDSVLSGSLTFTESKRVGIIEK
ncbi:hypothetical protein tinsulaeT_13970 [Thalassotalea insulae]|uniref:FTP domain-containing protein n=1 Tax=Thalassotalea insulae TaxID=2056778 RepID=A0ABQ6GQ54_9GAMM|nr:DUF6702 family protein [Thalassotalea insulae]GLX78057.1 hypothetical protein tinsulaeT_13970 [Thalassotalea insulae]